MSKRACLLGSLLALALCLEAGCRLATAAARWQPARTALVASFPTASATPTSTPLPPPTATPTLSAVVTTIAITPSFTSFGAAPSIAELGQALARVVAGQRDPAGAALAALRQWGFVPESGGNLQALGGLAPVLQADVDGDGNADLIVAAVERSSELFPAATLLVLRSSNGGYTPLFDSYSLSQMQGPIAILALTDLNGDGAADVVFAQENCGAHTCFTYITPLSCAGATCASLADEIAAAYADRAEIADRDGDGLIEIAVHGNTYGSIGAGPQRASTTIYKLVGGSYKQDAVLYDPSDKLLFVVLDANQALAAGDVQKAISLYTKAIADPSLKPAGNFAGWSEQEELEALRSFARFRLVVSYCLAGKRSAAEEALAQERQARGPFAPALETFWHTFAETGDVTASCAAVTTYMQRSPEVVDIMNSFGYANPQFRPEDMCLGAGLAP